MTPHPFLAEFQDAVAAKDRAATLDLLTGDVVLFGTAAVNLDRATTDAYLQRNFEPDGIVRWDWETPVPEAACFERTRTRNGLVVALVRTTS